MKKLLLSSVALAVMSAGAMAADLPSRRAAPAPYVAVPVFTWTGFYVGVNAGYGFSDSNRNNVFGLPAGSVINSAGTNGVLTLNNVGDSNRDGFVGGGQVGYNYQMGMFVLGIEADAQYKDFGNRSNTGFGGTYTFVGATGIAFAPPAAAVGFGNDRSSSDFFGTVRGRLGVAFDRTLIYGTGGFAYDEHRSGYAAGGGVEYAFTPNLTGKIEGLYVNLDRNNNNGSAAFFNPALNTVTLNDRRNNDFAVVRAGINYKFNGF
ncbi:outer membrane beta-barrel protein [Enterovirga sp.]|jgi:outer membrane immunogenic protein|uniref:outer membrane protein n=1 Tax=Enterovirga sp. TaxID=2026350 RepID=UPI00262E7B52|nr:outer membrane beta-barrel protein [Enterovirga sp.]MDB5590988.1 Porin [Enterovirga sp.]